MTQADGSHRVQQHKSFTDGGFPRGPLSPAAAPVVDLEQLLLVLLVGGLSVHVEVHPHAALGIVQ